MGGAGKIGESCRLYEKSIFKRGNQELFAIKISREIFIASQEMNGCYVSKSISIHFVFKCKRIFFLFITGDK